MGARSRGAALGESAITGVISISEPALCLPASSSTVPIAQRSNLAIGTLR